MGIELKNVHYKVSDKVILENISLKFENGFYALLGLNGAGKTSLINILSTLKVPTKGEFIYNNKSVCKNKSLLRRDLGFMSQNIGLIQDFTIEQNLYYFGLMKGCDSRALKSRIPQLLEQFNLLNEKEIKIQNLSGGTKQRVGFVLAIINSPKVLILDEPINNLDSFEREKMYSLLKEISKDSIIIISTHLITEIIKYCDEIVLLRDGKLVHKGKYESFINNDSETRSSYNEFFNEF